MDLKQRLRQFIEIVSHRWRLSRSKPPTRTAPYLLLGPWEAGWALDVYRYKDSTQRSEIGRLLWRYKYRGRIDLADKLADHVIALLERYPNPIDGIVVVPPSTVRLYDPLRLLGQTLARRLGITFYADLLIKTRPTARQKEMHTRAQKRANVQGAFAVHGAVHRKSLLALDDLYDSGETLKEVTRVLKRAGARSVYVLALACTQYSEQAALARVEQS